MVARDPGFLPLKVKKNNLTPKFGVDLQNK